MATDCNAFITIVEVDENQHLDRRSGYSDTCMEARMNELYNDYGLPVYVVRFNPDGYTKGGNRFKPMFSFNEDGAIKLNKSECDKRYKTLEQSIKRLFEFRDRMELPPELSDSLYTEEYLFYNAP
jgi:hypothetical protein